MTGKRNERQDAKHAKVVLPDDAVVGVAESLAATRRLRGADCIHLASAMHVRDSLSATVILVASDAELLAAAAAEGFSTLDPVLDPTLPAA